MMQKKKDKVFMEITNKDLFSKLEKIEEHLNQIDIQTTKMNGKVRVHEKLIYAIGSALVLIVSWLLVA